MDSHKFLLQLDGGGKGTPRLKLRRGQTVEKYPRQVDIFHRYEDKKVSKVTIDLGSNQAKYIYGKTVDCFLYSLGVILLNDRKCRINITES